jgi:hypothetical protein
MFDIAILDEPAEKKNHYANREQTRSNEVCEPLSAQAVSPRIALIELFPLILFLTIAVVGVVICLAELSQLLDNDTIGSIARKAAGGV